MSDAYGKCRKIVLCVAMARVRVPQSSTDEAAVPSDVPPSQNPLPTPSLGDNEASKHVVVAESEEAAEEQEEEEEVAAAETEAKEGEQDMKAEKEEGEVDEDEEEEEEEDVCRICRTSGENGSPLYHPCACSGSIKYVHQDCLLQWLNHSNARHCEVSYLCGILCEKEERRR